MILAQVPSALRARMMRCACGRAFKPGRFHPQQKYCSAKCRWRDWVRRNGRANYVRIRSWRARNPDKDRAYSRNWRRKHATARAELNRAQQAAYRRRHRDRCRQAVKTSNQRRMLIPEIAARRRKLAKGYRAKPAARHAISSRTKRYIAALSDWYVRQSIRKGTALRANDIPDSLIRAKRANMQLQRMLNNMEESQ